MRSTERKVLVAFSMAFAATLLLETMVKPLGHSGFSLFGLSSAAILLPAMAIVGSEKISEDARRRTEELVALIDIVPSAIFIAHDPECRVITGNKMANRLYEAEEGENVSAGLASGGEWNRTRRFFRDGKELGPEELPMQQAAVTGKEVKDAELEVLLQDGKRRIIMGNACPLFDKEGKVRGVVASFLDITERKKVEKCLRESHEDMDRAQFVSHTGSWRLNVHRNELLWSDETYRMFGIPNGTPMTYDTFLGAIYLDDRDNVDQKWQAALRGEPYDIEHRIVVNGEIRWVREKAELEFNKDGVLQGGFGTVQDISERKKVQKAAEEVSGLLEEIIASSPEGIVVFDGQELRVKAMNDFYKQHFLDEPFRHMDLVGKRIEEFIPDVGETPVPELLRKVARTGAPFIAEEYEFEGFRRGKTYWNLAYVPIGFEGSKNILVTAIDVTEQVKARLRAEEGRVRLQIILDSLPVGVSVADANGRILIRNKLMNDFLGNVLLSEGISDYDRFRGYHPGTDTPLTPEEWPMARSLLKGETVINEELDILGKDYTRGTMISSSMPIKDNSGRITGGLVVFTDITKQKKLEGELKRSNKELEQFAYVASHDLKEPLRMVTSYLQLLETRNRDKLDDASKQYLHFAMDGSGRMQAMIGDILVYSRVETKGAPLAPVDMNDVLTTVVKDFRVSIEESGASITHAYLPKVVADKTQIVLLLENLVGNAIKYRDVAAPQINISAHSAGKEWVFAIKDNGIGIDPKYQDRLFRMFSRLHTREEYAGTGMGLAIAKKIVERHGGRIWVESEPGNGSTFCFTIPMQQ